MDDLEQPLVVDKEDDIQEIGSCQQFLREAMVENKKLWYLAGPAIFTSVAQYSIAAVTQIYAGHLSALELDALSTVNMVIGLLAFGIMLGMGSALETLCGQAFGAKQLHMLGVYMQRSWVILIVASIFLMFLYIFATPLLKLFGFDKDIAELSGLLSLYLIPELFAFAINSPLQKFLQAQSKVMAMAWMSGLALVFHIALCWILIVHMKLGLAGAAISQNLSWWLLDFGQFGYIALGNCPNAWNGFSWDAFKDLGAFARLSIASGAMLCLELWYYMFLVVLAGRLENAKVAVAAISICTNLSDWELMLFLGFNAAISVRISNELGAGRPRAAKFSILVAVATSFAFGLFAFALVLALRDVYPIPFTNSTQVAHAASKLGVMLALMLLFNSVQPLLTGVAVGAGWQSVVAFINVGCYYVVGIPLGFLLGSWMNWGIMGIWSGLVSGVALQTLVLIVLTLSTNWSKEAMEAESRIRKWGGSLDSLMNTHKEEK